MTLTNSRFLSKQYPITRPQALPRCRPTELPRPMTMELSLLAVAQGPLGLPVRTLTAGSRALVCSITLQYIHPSELTQW